MAGLPPPRLRASRAAAQASLRCSSRESRACELEKITHDKAYLEGKVVYFGRQQRNGRADPALEELFQHLKLLVEGARRHPPPVVHPAPASNGTPGLTPCSPAASTSSSQSRSSRARSPTSWPTSCRAPTRRSCRCLALLDVKERVTKVIELLDRQVGDIKNNIKITAVTTTTLPFADPDAARKQLDKIIKHE